MKRSPIKPTSAKRAAEIKGGAKMQGTFKIKAGAPMSAKVVDTVFGKKRKPLRGRKPTGEARTLDRLIRERGPYSEISGEPLVEKGHDRYHWQLFHILGKGEFPELRLTDANLLLSTPDEQDAWTRHKYLLKNQPEWERVFTMEATLKLEAHQRLNAELSGKHGH